jgi:pimeloyl-ACP methyl ester carboxylesterase
MFVRHAARIVAFVSGVLGLISTEALAAEQCDTFRSSQGTAAPYCLNLPDGGAEPEFLVLHMHSMGGNEHAWTQYSHARNIAKAFEDNGRKFAALTPSFGTFWLMKETQNPAGISPLMPVVEELLEATKGRFRPGLPVVLIGMSLGGYNGLQFYFKRPHLFSAFALGGPAVADGSPFGNENEVVNTYVNRTRARLSSAQVLVRNTRDQFLDQADFDLHDPLALARRMSAPNSYPPLLLEVGNQDHFGFQAGTIVMQNLLRFNGVRLEFDLLSGGWGLFDHVEMDAPRTATFLWNSLRQP